MPYLVERTTHKDAMTLRQPFGPGFPQELADQAEAMEWWGSSIMDGGADWNEFRLFVGDEVIARRRMAGY